jgi:linoleoyl-CoA desaturase
MVTVDPYPWCMHPASATPAPAPAAVRFTSRGAFHADLKRSVDRYFTDSGRSPRADARMWIKSAVILAWAAGSYLLLVLADVAAWERVLLAASLGFAMAGIGFDVMHDANHGSYVGGPRGNRLIGFALDLIGGSSYLWRHKHNVLHHTYTNVSGVDTDLGGNAVLRFAPDQPHRPIMRFQHLYVWALYAVYPLGWWFVDDFHRLVTGRIGGNVVPRPRARDVAVLLLGKALFFGWAVIVPVALHRSWLVIPFAAITVATLGVTLAVTFQLAHCVPEADFHDARMQPAGDWAVHQVTTTVDFARGNRLLGWYLGGLNFQVEHHLFPKVCHVHYPALSRIVEETCAAHGVRYTAQPSLRAALGSNVRWLRQLGRGAPRAVSPPRSGPTTGPAPCAS